MTKVDFDQTFTFKTGSYISFLITAVGCSKFIEKYADSFVTKKHQYETIHTVSYEPDIDVSSDVMSDGRYVFSYNSKLFELVISAQQLVYVQYQTGDQWIVDHLLHAIKEANFLKSKHLYLFQSSSGIYWKIKEPPKIQWNDITFNPELKEKIFDSTVMHMDLLGSNNGTILYGPPGTGKSYLCQGLITSALSRDYSTCYITNAVDFSQLETLLKDFLNPCLLIVEDVDSFAEDRMVSKNNVLASFLQFLSGLTDTNGNTNVVATTNYIERLDKAVGDRPMRFNSKYLVDYLDNEQRNEILDLEFKEDFGCPCWSKKYR